MDPRKPKYVIIAPAVFHGTPTRSAYELSAEWLDSLATDAYEPLTVVAKGNSAKLTICGAENGCIVLVRK